VSALDVATGGWITSVTLTACVRGVYGALGSDGRLLAVQSWDFRMEVSFFHSSEKTSC
jgi:hypothetical protein